ncbi:MAG: ABC transporter substrate-binding protein [Gammaproteobacteria bacterium]|nr:ABC transporter substrate-binding protein [Gammaproteobacteria bacterium]
MTKKTVLISLALIGLTALNGCSGPKDKQESNSLGTNNFEEVSGYYEAHPEFFVFRDIEDLPANLKWEDGSHLAEIGSESAKKGGTEYRRLQDFPRTLRIVGPDSNGSFRPMILDYVTMPLAARPPDEFDFYPALARSWAIDQNNKTVYIKLEPEAKWSDGQPITTQDFLFMFFFYQSNYIVAPWYNNWYGTQYSKITRYDQHTFSITVPENKPDMDSRVLGLRPVPRHYYVELGDDFIDRYQWKFPPTTSPYTLDTEKDLKKGRSITLRRDKNWWAKDKKNYRYRFNTDKIQFTVIRDNAKHFEAFRRGDIDQFDLTLSQYWYEKLPDDDPDVNSGYIQKTVFFNQHPRPTYGLWINTNKDLLDQKSIRVGIQHASNWDLVIESFFRGDYKRMKTSSDGYGEFSHPIIKAREFNIEKAQTAFAEAGFVERGDDGILKNLEGKRLSFTVSTGYERFQDILTILKEEAEKAGLELIIEVLDSTTGWKKVQEKKHDIHFVAFNVGLEMYPRFWETYHSDNAYYQPFLPNGTLNPNRKIKTQTNNLEMLAIPEMDRMINAYRASSSKEEMKKLAHNMTKLHHEHASFVPGFVQPGYRLGYWRWVRYPEHFNYKYTRSSTQLFVHWIDEKIKTETWEARDKNKSFSPKIETYDQFAE